MYHNFFFELLLSPEKYFDSYYFHVTSILSQSVTITLHNHDKSDFICIIFGINKDWWTFDQRWHANRSRFQSKYFWSNLFLLTCRRKFLSKFHLTFHRNQIRFIEINQNLMRIFYFCFFNLPIQSRKASKHQSNEIFCRLFFRNQINWSRVKRDIQWCVRCYIKGFWVGKQVAWI